MADILREIVSDNKVRYVADGYNLDLTYITPNIIAMGFPSSNFESVYRNDVDDVVRFLEERHRGHYLVVNLCSEKFYNPGKFGGRVVSFPIDDHGPPPFRMLLPFCAQVEDFLSRNPNNVVAVHCRAGRDRTGTMISAYLLYSGMARSSEDAMRMFALQRTYDGKRVIIPSQRRYVRYFEQILNSSRKLKAGFDSIYRPVNLLLTAIVISPVPNRGGFECDTFFTVKSSGSRLFTSETFDSCRFRDPRTSQLVMVPRKPVLCSEDVKIVIYGKVPIVGKEEMFRFWLNTFFLGTIGAPAPQPHQEILSGGGNLRPIGPGPNPGCANCQSNQPYLSHGPSGRFVSVVRLENTGPVREQIRPADRGGCGCGCSHQVDQVQPSVRQQKAVTLGKSEVEGSERVGPNNVTVTVFFVDA